MIPTNSCELSTSFWDNILGSLVQFAKDLMGQKIAQSQGLPAPLQCWQKYDLLKSVEQENIQL